MSVTPIWIDWTGDSYGFCSMEHLKMFRRSMADPSAPKRNPADTDASIGCWWCGEDLTKDVEMFESADALEEKFEKEDDSDKRGAVAEAQRILEE